MFKRIRNFILSLTAAAMLITTVLITPVLTFSSADTQQTEKPAENAGAGFYVSAQIPENQSDIMVSYFDLLMQPGARQTIAVKIVNEGGFDIVVDVSVISASTNEIGLIDYQTPDVRDETLLHPLSELAVVQRPVLKVPAYGSITALVDIEMPEEEYDGVVLGGIIISRREDMDEQISDTEQNSIALINRYAYVVGVKLTETDTILQPNFTLRQAAPQAVNYKAAIVHYLLNDEALIVKNLDVSLVITDLNSDEIIHVDEWTIDMAPNSVIKLPAYMEDGELIPGSYTSHMALALEDEIFELDHTFTIDEVQIKEAEGTIITVNSTIPAWAWFIIILLIVFIAVITPMLFLIIFKSFKGKKDKDDVSKNTRF